MLTLLRLPLWSRRWRVTPLALRKLPFSSLFSNRAHRRSTPRVTRRPCDVSDRCLDLPPPRRVREREEEWMLATGWRLRESLSAARRGESDMASAVQKIKLSPSRDIPFNKLVLSQSNVRRVKAGVSIEQLAESIAQR